VDDSGNVWIAAQGSGETSSKSNAGATTKSASVPPEDAHVLKFSPTGEFLLQIGKAGELGSVESQTRLNYPAAVAVDTAANEVFVADGGTSQRVVVFDATTGTYKRHWRTSPVTTSRTAVLAARGLVRETVKPFTRLSSITLSRDGSVYVGDRESNCIQVFKKDGAGYTFGFLPPTTKGPGAAWAMTLSKDPQQFRLFVADGEQVIVLGRRGLQIQSAFGQSAAEPGTASRLGAITVDSKGNVYTGDTAGGSGVQRFLFTRPPHIRYADHESPSGLRDCSVAATAAEQADRFVISGGFSVAPFRLQHSSDQIRSDICDESAGNALCPVVCPSGGDG
jgi:DNA-binding beta-propeller fold protein YncE